MKEEATKGMNQKCPANTETPSEDMAVDSVTAELDIKAEEALKKEILSEELDTQTVAHESENTSGREDLSQQTGTGTGTDPSECKNQLKRKIIQCEESKDACLIEAVDGVAACKKQRSTSSGETEDMSDCGKDTVASPENGKPLQQIFRKLDCHTVGQYFFFFFYFFYN